MFALTNIGRRGFATCVALVIMIVGLNSTVASATPIQQDSYPAPIVIIFQETETPTPVAPLPTPIPSPTATQSDPPPTVAPLPTPIPSVAPPLPTPTGNPEHNQAKSCGMMLIDLQNPEAITAYWNAMDNPTQVQDFGVGCNRNLPITPFWNEPRLRLEKRHCGEPWMEMDDAFIFRCGCMCAKGVVPPRPGGSDDIGPPRPLAPKVQTFSFWIPHPEGAIIPRNSGPSAGRFIPR